MASRSLRIAIMIRGIPGLDALMGAAIGALVAKGMFWLSDREAIPVMKPSLSWA